MATTGDTETLRLTIHEMLNDGVTDSRFLEESRSICGKAQLGRCACTSRSGLDGGGAATRRFLVSRAAYS